ncbi:hypothetical protein M413DRAFT_445842 [Hebeloma cylindrosporum]|uniref:SH3 domain-containing protein n=1 Tax=Hebeloma cylindrosporum TaxID=76867 RepID=A0A0C2XU18_HEBCY|nr:hypothetical protein M413DRAFT_445842 [Hebeloma cylindrosporum h7]
MEKSLSYASERPPSEGVPNPHVPENATADGNGTAVAEPAVQEGVGGVVPGGEISEGKPRKSGSELFLLGTFALGLIGWIVSTVSQAVVAATISRAPVRILWFAFVIQTILNALILLVILGSTTYNAAYAYGTQISIFAALATTFAVLGVDQNVYSPFSAQQATAAGWLILAIVDLSWIIFFTSPPQSPIFSVVESFAARRQESRQNKVEKIERSTDAFPLSPVHGGGVGSTRRLTRLSRGSAPPQLDQQNPRVTGGDWALYTPPQKSGGRGTITSITSEPKTGTASGRVQSAADVESHVSGSAGPDEALSQGAGSKGPTAQWKAEALFPYKGSESDPNELSFKKGEVLLIFDKSGKWWEAQTRGGKTGIAPSNYLRLIE